MDKLAQATAHAREMFERNKLCPSGPLKPDARLLLALANLLSDERQLPPGVGKYAVAPVLRAAAIKKQGRKKETNELRDLVIYLAVYEMQQFGFEPTRNRAQRKHECGCSIVSEVLGKLDINLGEKGVADVWEKVGKQQKQGQVKQLIALLISDQKPAAPSDQPVTGMFATPPKFVPD